jgi:hypothetical protein
MLNKLLGAILGAPAEKIAEYFQQRQKLKADLRLKKLEGKVKIEEAKTLMRIKELQSDTTWELRQIQNSGWKDEWVLILLSIPLVLVFFPVTAAYVLQGFEILEQTPEWYRYLIIMIFAAIYGIRVWRRGDKAKLLKSKKEES